MKHLLGLLGLMALPLLSACQASRAEVEAAGDACARSGASSCPNVLLGNLALEGNRLIETSVFVDDGPCYDNPDGTFQCQNIEDYNRERGITSVADAEERYGAIARALPNLIMGAAFGS